MKKNKITVLIQKPVQEVFRFVTTAPNSKKWIPGIVKDKTNEWPIRIGTVYTLYDKKGKTSKVTIKVMKKNEFVEWISEDRIYHCRYTFEPANDNLTEFIYEEWVDKGELAEQFTLKTLKKLKQVMENDI